MKSIQNQYRDLKEGKMSQANFMRNLRMQFPQYVTNVTSFNDAVKILKNKAILTESLNENRAFDVAKALKDKYNMDEEAIYVYLVDDMGLNNMAAQSVVDKLFKDDSKEINTNEEEEILAMIDKIEQEKAGEEEIKAQWDIAEEELTAKQIVDKYYEMFNKNPQTTFKDVAKALGVDEERVAVALGLTAIGFREDLNEGKGKDLDIDKVHPGELRMGIKVEMEHTTDPEKAKKIALDHLAENPFYYTALKLSGIESPSAPKVKEPKEKKSKKKEAIQLVDLVNGMKKVKMPKTVKEAMEVDPIGNLINTPDEKTLLQRIEKNPSILQALKNINIPSSEADGTLYVWLKNTGFSDVSIQTLMSALKKAWEKLQKDDWPSSKVANKVFSAPQQQALSKAFQRGDFKESLREMIRQELNEYEAGDENDKSPSKKNAASEITANAIDYIDDYNEGESKEYKKAWLENVFDSYESKMGKRYGDSVFEDVIDKLKDKGYLMKETFDGRDNLIDPIAAIEK